MSTSLAKVISIMEARFSTYATFHHWVFRTKGGPIPNSQDMFTSLKSFVHHANVHHTDSTPPSLDIPVQLEFTMSGIIFCRETFGRDQPFQAVFNLLKDDFPDTWMDIMLPDEIKLLRCF